MSGTPWEDRRGMFQRGKEVHEPAKPRRPSQASTGGSISEAVRRASVGSQTGGSSPTLEKSPTAGSISGAGGADSRRRSSAAGQSGMFANLTSHKRGSEDYAERRASHGEMIGGGGVLGGWFNKTFRGTGAAQAGGGPQQGGGAAAAGGGDQKRGVME